MALLLLLAGILVFFVVVVIVEFLLLFNLGAGLSVSFVVEPPPVLRTTVLLITLGTD